MRTLPDSEAAAVVSRLVLDRLAFRIAAHLPKNYSGDVEQFRRAILAAGIEDLDAEIRSGMIENHVDPDLATAQFSEDPSRHMTTTLARKISDANQVCFWRYSR